jgi:hypothetical protein
VATQIQPFQGCKVRQFGMHPFFLGASQNVVLIKRLVSNLIYNLPKSLQRRDFHTLQVPPLEGFREVKVDKRQFGMHPFFLQQVGFANFTNFFLNPFHGFYRNDVGKGSAACLEDSVMPYHSSIISNKSSEI